MSEDLGKVTPGDLSAVRSSRTSGGFSFIDINYSVTDKKTKQEKLLLTNISGGCAQGKVLAILGPSGAGKTMLLNTITLVSGPGTASGHITLNGQPMSNSLFAEHCAVVTQVDRHWAFLTCREHIELAVSFYQPSASPADQKSQVEDLLTRMGLTSCQNTRAGNQFVQGLSGGQKRRLSLAIALAKKPSCVFLDEPTSGLDAAAAAAIMKFLKDLARSTNITIIATIHQPSATVFAGFEDVMVLAGGRTAFFGSAESLPTHLNEIGKPVPMSTNPAEHVLDICNADFTSKKEVDEVLDAYASKALQVARPAPGSVEAAAPKSSFFGQVAILLKRHGKLVYRDPMLYGARCGMFLMATVFFAVVYVKARDRVQDQVLNRMFVAMWYAGVPANLGVIAVFALNFEFHAIKDEVKDGMYSPGAYVIAHTLLQIPLMFVMAVFALGVSAYAITDFTPEMFPQMILIFAMQLWAFECIAQAHSLMPNPLVGMLGFLNIWFTSFLFAGVLLPEEDVVWPLRAFVYVLPFRWGLSAMVHTEYIKAPDYSGAESCTPGVGMCGPKGFYCPGDKSGGLQCFGTTGAEVLDSIQVSYNAFSSTDTVGRDIFYMICIAVVFKVAFVIGLFRACCAGTPPLIPEKSGHAKIIASEEAKRKSERDGSV